MKISPILYKKLLAFLLVLACALAAAVTVSAQTDEPAAEVSEDCIFTASSGRGKIEHLTNNHLNGSYTVSGKGEQSLTIDLGRVNAAGIYIKWGRTASPWIMETVDSNGVAVQSEPEHHGFMQEYAAVPEGTKTLRIITRDGESNPLSIAEIDVYSPGKLPDSVHFWEPTPSTAEIMFVATHQDDEILFFGGAIPYYSGELKMDTLVVYSAGPFYNERYHEALDGLWTCGLTQHPVFLNYPDEHAGSIDAARKIWSEDDLVADLTRLILEHRPQVIITQDENGEYGHGQHLLTVHGVKQALEKACSEEYVSQRFPELNTWEVKKCYLHLYAENNIIMPWDKMILESAGGKSAFDVACDAYECHVSQVERGNHFVNKDPDGYDCRNFGLYWTTVGPDTGEPDFFRNVTPRLEVLEPPPEEIAAYTERVGTNKYLYRFTVQTPQAGEYIRYCSIGGTAGWYKANYTGSLLEPYTKIIPAIDRELPIAEYKTLTQVSRQPALYQYTESENSSGRLLRYCSVANGEAAFYAADDNGNLVDPPEKVDVSRVYISLDSAEHADRQSCPVDSTSVLLIINVIMPVLFSIVYTRKKAEKPAADKTDTEI